MDVSEYLALPAEQLTAHQPPALLVERALSIDGVNGCVVLKAHDGLDCFQMTEACAQALAVIMGLRMRGDGTGQSASGMLVGAKAMRLLRPITAGEVVTVCGTQTAELGPLQLYEVRAEIAGEVVMTGELKVARTGGAS
jgi:predicted hotdog family 3-hydroxylacyl-ACP dehydratase